MGTLSPPPASFSFHLLSIGREYPLILTLSVWLPCWRASGAHASYRRNVKVPGGPCHVAEDRLLTEFWRYLGAA